jgi:hypothetical protein
MAVSRILSIRRDGRDDHLSHRISPTPATFSRSVVRRYPEIGPEFHRGICGPAVLLLFCLTPHGVFPAIPLARDAVSFYLAFSPLPALFSKNRRYVFCDTVRRRNFSTAPPAYSTRHAAVWCSDFPLANLATHQRSSAIMFSLTHPAAREREGAGKIILYQQSPSTNGEAAKHYSCDTGIFCRHMFCFVWVVGL